MDVNQLSLRQKVGQLMMFGFSGLTVSEDIRQLIAEDYVGGIILFARNIGTPSDVLRLTSDLQAVAKQTAQPNPLLIAIDQENGAVRRLGKGPTLFPGNMLLGAIDEPEATRAVARATGAELKALGINMNLAPVLDVNNNPHNPVIGVRAFGEDPEKVSTHGTAAIAGYREAGVLATAKHFPGHGDTHTDSHLALPTIAHDLERLERVEFVPFKRGIQAGVECVMVAHVYFPALEPGKDVPATLSRAVVTGLLREKMGFSGVVTTDCLEMKAISEGIGTAEGALRALKAGCDILMVSHTAHEQKAAIERIVQAVEQGELAEEILDAAVARVLNMKQNKLTWDDVPPPVGGKAHQQLAERLYARGVTVVKNEGILPLDDSTSTSGDILVVTPEKAVSTLVEDVEYADYRLADALRAHSSRVTEVTFSVDGTVSDAEMESLVVQAQSADTVIVGTVNMHLKPTQAELVRTLLTKNKRLIVVAMRNPYDLMAVPDVPAYVATYEFTFPALCACADVIFGKTEAQGKLPVTIPLSAPTYSPRDNLSTD
ncbi:beta-N-acetylhexosaminidase [Numidum massiliense]|uniref:beta-N-acetylhexosaminidase n=1 Tax=Numidum massiliense TaxID=1522315 RepID=UPI000A85A684|nr:beta-N-acetylhexosaminidase [Numidum massiliense]